MTIYTIFYKYSNAHYGIFFQGHCLVKADSLAKAVLKFQDKFICEYGCVEIDRVELSYFLD